MFTKYNTNAQGTVYFVRDISSVQVIEVSQLILESKYVFFLFRTLINKSSNNKVINIKQNKK